MRPGDFVKIRSGLPAIPGDDKPEVKPGDTCIIVEMLSTVAMVYQFSGGCHRLAHVSQLEKVS